MKIPSLSEIQFNLSQNNHSQNGHQPSSSTLLSDTEGSAEDSFDDTPSDWAVPATEAAINASALKQDALEPNKPEASSIEKLDAKQSSAKKEVGAAKPPLVAQPSDLAEILDIYLQQAEAYCNESQWDKAIAACQEAIAIAPQKASVYRLFGNILQRQGKLTDAMGFYAKALTIRPGSPEVYSNLGSIHARRKDWDLAIAYFQKAIDKDPHFAAAYHNLAKVWKKLGKAEQELACLQAALRLQPDLEDADTHYRIGQSLENEKKAAEAIAFYRQAIARSPNFLPAYERLVELLENLGDWQSAVTYYRKVVELTAERSSSSELATNDQAAAKTNSQNSEQNGKGINVSNTLSIRQSTNQQSQRSSTQAKISLSPEDQQRVKKLLQASSTRQLLRPATSQNQQPPQTAKPKISLSAKDQQLVQKLLQASSTKRLIRPIADSNALSQQPKLIQQAAPARFSAFSAEDPLASQAALIPATPQTTQQAAQTTQSTSKAAQLGMHYAKAQDWPRAIQHLQQAIQSEPQSAVLYRTIASALACNQQPQQAAMAWYRAFVLDPHWPNAQQYLQVGSALQAQDKLEAAANCYKQAIRLQPTMRVAYHQLARLLQAQGNLTAAQAVLQRGETIANAPSSQQPSAQPSALAVPPTVNRRIAQAQALHQQGEKLREEQQWEMAIAAYQKAIELNPNFSWSHHNIGTCYKKVGNWAAAATAYQRAIELEPDFVWSHYSIAEVAEAQEDWPAAARHYRHALTLDEHNIQIPPRLSSVLRQLIDREPRNIDYYRELAELQVLQDREEEAIATYQMALQIRPDESTIALALSKLIGKQDPQKAHALIDRALSYTVTNRDIKSLEDLEDLETTAALLSATHLFDAQYYRATNRDLSINNDRDLLLHYLRQGSAEGRNPNPLFDEQYYRQLHPDLAKTNTNSLAHFHRFGHLAGDDPHPFFKTAFYREVHEDVAAANINPLEHYLAYGAKEGRTAFSFEQLAHIIEQSTPTDADYLAPWLAAKNAEILETAPQKVAIYCNSLGNYFITEIADFLAAAMRQTGHYVEQLTDNDTPPQNFDSHWVIAPHEFFYLGEGAKWMQEREWLSQAVLVNVEQPQTTWFSKAFHFLRQAKVIFDINVKSTAILRSLQLPAYWLPLGYLPQHTEATAQLPDLRALKSLPASVRNHLPEIDAPLSARPIDLHFIGTLNPRREEFFAKSAEWLSQFHSFLHIPPMGMPLLKGQDQALDTEAVVGLSRRSKILLNIHRDELPYFEWHRIIFHGLWQNTLVVTEPCHDIPGLVAGKHFIECSLAEMPEKIESLLKDPLGQSIAEKVRRAGHQAIKEQFNGMAIANSALQIAQQRLATSLKLATITGGSL